MKKSIEDLYYSVVVTNGDCYIVENNEQAEELNRLLDNSIISEVGDGEEFEIAAGKLDFSEQVPPRRIYRMTNNEDINSSGYVCFAEDYGD